MGADFILPEARFLACATILYCIQTCTQTSSYMSICESKAERVNSPRVLSYVSHF